eukprot:1611076-Rhodomonas_salina.1
MMKILRKIEKPQEEEAPEGDTEKAGALSDFDKQKKETVRALEKRCQEIMDKVMKDDKEWNRKPKHIQKYVESVKSGLQQYRDQCKTLEDDLGVLKNDIDAAGERDGITAMSVQGCQDSVQLIRKRIEKLEADCNYAEAMNSFDDEHRTEA